jgi:DNA end-binding protein Ku
MPHAIWSGAISFGLVTIPIRVTAATEDHSLAFRQIHLEDMGRVRVRKVCELEDREVPQQEIGKGYEWSKDQIIPVTDEELAQMPLPTAKAIDVVAFVPYESIDPIRIGAGYYLEADGQVAGKPYVLLRKALERSRKAAITKFALRGRERLGLLRIRDDAIVLHALHWDDEIRDPSSLAPEPVTLSDGEVEEAMRLIEAQSSGGLEDLDLADQYTEALEKVIEAKREGYELPEAPEPASMPPRVVDLMAALEESVAKAKASRGEESTHGASRKPAKKAARKPRRSA